MTNSNQCGQISLLALALSLGAMGCHDRLPCPDCDEQADEQTDEQTDDDPVPDLPCEGVDLMNDPLNCGTCGNECKRGRPDTPWEAFSCQAGECGPNWSICESEASGSTCAEICASFDRSCYAAGCGGYTALLLNFGFDGYCGTKSEPFETMTGACDEPISWTSPFPGQGYNTYVSCCCGYE